LSKDERSNLAIKRLSRETIGDIILSPTKDDRHIAAEPFQQKNPLVRAGSTFFSVTLRRAQRDVRRIGGRLRVDG